MSYTNRNVTRTKHFKMVRGDTLTFGVKLKLVSDNSPNTIYFSIMDDKTGEYIVTRSLNNGIWYTQLRTIRVFQTPIAGIEPLSGECFSYQDGIAPHLSKYEYVYLLEHDYIVTDSIGKDHVLYKAGTLFVWNGDRYILASDFWNDNGLVSSSDYESGYIYAIGIRVPPSETAGLDPGEYWYDLQIGVKGNIKTVLRGKITIDLEVTVI